MYVNESGTIFIAGGIATSWAEIYNNDGTLVSTWNDPTDNLAQGAYQVAVQKCGRFIVAGQGASYGELRGYSLSGDLDFEFGINGIFSTGVTAPITDLFIDDLDNIIICYIVDGASVMQQVSSQGITVINLDAGIAITDVMGQELKIVQDVIGNIVLAAATSSGFSLRRYDSSGANNPATAVTIDVGSSSSHLGNIYVTSDNKVGLVGYESIDGDIICARLDATFELDITFDSGIALITTDSPMDIVYDATVYVDSRILIVGGSSSLPDPYMARVFGDAYVAVISQSPFPAISCTKDLTFGPDENGNITFYGLTGDATQSQIARAVGLQDAQNIIIALDGQSSENTENRMFVNVLNAQGQLQDSFGIGGKVEIPHTYQNEYVTDMITFTVAGVCKAVLVGYIVNNDIAITNSFMLGYNVTAATLDITFGGFDSNPQGFVCGDGQNFYAVAQQSMGRIIAAGCDHATQGLLVGYTSAGQLDYSFGYNGLWQQASNPIFKHLIDRSDRIVIAYNDGADHLAVARILADGSNLDASVNFVGVTPGIISASDMISGIMFIF